MKEYYELLKSWCDKLCEYQIKELKDDNFYGGILCPACALIHGRIGDSVYPLTAMYDYCGDEKYLEAAKLAVDWSERNVRRKSGGYFNDKASSWMGISVFSAIAFGETLLYHGKCLDSETLEKWTDIFVRLSDFVYDFFVKKRVVTNINYHASTAAAMAIAYTVTNDEKYKIAAYESADYVNGFFTEEGLLFGECTPLDIKMISKKGCRGVDIGYDVEESLPALILFAHYMKDDARLDFYAEKFRVHLEFMLPDGAWDNSWGTRSNKWSYWGSRTSDGCQTALCLLSDKDPIFAEAAQRNFRMYQKCSGNGFLYGGYMYREAGEDGCLHHSFCHAKALCSMIDNGFSYKGAAELPRDKEYGLKYFPSVHINLISLGDFRATVSDYDIISYVGSAKTGGTMTVLWNKKVGPIFAASMAEYQTSEPRNMQFSRHIDKIENTSLRVKNGKFESVNETDALTVTEAADGKISIKSTGKLKNTAFKENGSYELAYVFTKNSLEVTAVSDTEGRLVIPVICAKKDSITADGLRTVIHRERADVILESSDNIIFDTTVPERNFNVVGGFETAPLFMKLRPNEKVTFTLSVR